MIQPVVGSRYAPARMPVPEMPESEVDSKLSTEGRGTKVEESSTGSSALGVGNSLRQAITRGSAEAPPAKAAGHSSPVQPEPIPNTVSGKEMQQPRALPVSDQEEAQAYPDMTNATVFDRSTVQRALVSASGETQAQPIAEPRADYSASEKSSVVEMNSENFESVEATLAVLSPNREGAQGIAFPEERNLWANETGAFVPESDSGLLVTPAKTRRTTNGGESFPKSFTPESEPALRLRDDPVEKTPPMIRVTIGRIEVRAVTQPSPPPQSSAPPAPKLSLDEFLQQHNGRRR